MEQHSIKVIARIRSDFKTKFGVPRQSGLVEALRARIVFEPEYRNADALRGIEGFSHLWLIWQFSEAVREDWSPTVRPPRLGGNERMGRVRHTLAVPPERHRPFLRAARGRGADGGGERAARLRRGPDGRHAHL